MMKNLTYTHEGNWSVCGLGLISEWSRILEPVAPKPFELNRLFALVHFGEVQTIELLYELIYLTNPSPVTL